MEQALIENLKKLVGDENVIHRFEDRFCYTYDASFAEIDQKNIPGAVVFPETTEQVAAVMKFAYAHKITVIPRGAGSNVSGGTLAVADGLIMVLTKMDKILEIDRDNLLVVVETGVKTGRLQQEVEKMGLFYPPDPASLAFSTIGGNVAESAGGPRGVKYGTTKDYVLGMEVVLPTGEILNTGGRVIKNVTGYNLTQLFTGSEGTLGIITKVILKLVPKPEGKKTLLAVFNEIEGAGQAVSGIIAQGIIPTTIELLDDVYIKNIEEYAHVGFPLDAGAVLLIEVDGDKEVLDKQAGKIERVCQAAGAREVKIARNQEEAEELWKARRAAFASCARLKPTIIGEDATVPRSAIPAMIAKIREIARKYEVLIAVVGHAGDGNLHATFLCDEMNQEEMARVEKAIDETFYAALELKGTLSGEHGIGRAKAPFIKMQIGEEGYRVMKKIKLALDPENLLNPGVMFGE
ncbi:FAD-binding oxidoreductase [Desulfitobacterium chlororespirans]|uniref:Glycolate oxidase n=1 Tax=Desulfitobacterium chlororespirans DSM 11544 TaxID=1121395 RepID=A0A1M7S3K9_9FIRM|nr:FAD-linked oxidase C-terminal domain-containing protein [Desulfitobacterium chlororespirans]SHN53249.1 glycolate oxidase [Desulfitobacterium chlororespirans DSM 11544]